MKEILPLKTKRRKIKCVSPYRCWYQKYCKNCYFVRTERGESWVDDKVWCIAPFDLKYGQTIHFDELENGNMVRYKITGKQLS